MTNVKISSILKYDMLLEAESLLGYISGGLPIGYNDIVIPACIQVGQSYDRLNL